MDNDNSEMFNIGNSNQTKVNNLHLFNQQTQIIKEGQRFKVIYGTMEQQKKSFSQIVSPYLYTFAANTAEIATRAGSNTIEALKNGIIWVYNKFVNNVIPYAIENLPSILFIVKKQQQKQIQPYKSSSIQVLIDEDDFNKIEEQKKQQTKTRVVIPLGTQNDKHFQQFIRNQKYEVNYSFPIDLEQSQQIRVKPAFMIPSQSFELICEQVKQSHTQLQIQQPQNYKKVVYRLNNCFIFQLQGQNTIQYDMLDSIEKAKDTKVGYIMQPQQTLRKSISNSEMDPISMMVNGIQPQKQAIQQQKQVDRQRTVHVEITNKKIKPQNQFALN